MEKQADALRPDRRYDNVKEYYGEVLQKSSDLKTDACCTHDALPAHIRKVLPLLPAEIKDKYYGCGSPIPLALEGLKILDVGCGTGRDCYIMSKLVGTDGFVSGIDMTKNQITVAEKYIDQLTAAFGYNKPNVKFVFDYIENLNKHFEKESLDVVTSNCVINLTEDKDVVFRQVYDVLKFGGELYFSDIYADRRVPKEIIDDPILQGECLGGAMYYRDFQRMARKIGFADPRIVSKRVLNIDDEQIRSLVGNVNFCSVTYRLWKIRGLEDACEDYGHIATYTDQIPDSPFEFTLDNQHVFCKNKPEKVCGNTALMLSQTRFKKYFAVVGDFERHFGAFEDCANVSSDNTTDNASSSCCS